ncbi:MAG: choline dehydrogenase [Sphingomonadaceae bacterium]|uniref:GMC family oxidoreductase n=1 Tax=Thermaurantiacus sp. TaxID=2820283 RepID=UPI00298F2073|nr:choline dehydrogenase [Thermaurantiacus sp.]MCS6987252.1 choline dehydrogenase [Sphingomonadaceae bacterium]MDW8414472.1 choline dehydrogenase [Thermaurantiacus sp.]
MRAADDPFDVVIAGAGSAGCVLAARLSEDPGTRVALVEAGGPDRSAMIAMPGGLAQIIPPEKASPLNWGYWTEPQRHLDGRRLYWPRGRVLGGSSAINGMVYIRGHPSDYDRWAQAGCTGWSWDDVRPYFLKSEDSDRGPSEWHGVGGPLKVTRRMLPHELNAAFLKAATEAGIPATDDFNGPRMEGASAYDSTIHGGERWSAARAYLTPEVRRRPNLSLMTDTLVERVTFAGRTATGLMLRTPAGPRALRARRVILCAGAVGSPQLLMLSGVGPAEHLQSLGLPVVADRPQVGANLQDHLDVLVQWKCARPISLNGRTGLLARLGAGMRWFLFRSGPASYMPTTAGAFVATRPGLAAPDIQMHFMPVLGAPHGAGGLSPEHGFQVHVCQLRPDSRGTVRLKSPDPAAPPAIDPDYLSAPQDLEILKAGIAIARRIGRQPALRPYNAGEVWPGDGVEGEALEAAIRRWAETIYHPVGTCRMGSDPEAVCTPTLEVNGVEGLMVVDASVMPFLVSGNTNAPTIMIAEKAADLLRERQRAPLARAA